MRWILAIVLLGLTANIQQLAAQLPDSAVWQVDAQWLEVDKLQNVYLIDTRGQVRKYSATGQEMFMYSNQELGPLQQFDATDPFNLLLYYPGFMTAVQLDRTLNERGRLAFADLGLPQIDQVAKSRDNLIWAYDPLGNRLLKLDATGIVLAESQNLSLLPQGPPTPTHLLATGNYVYLYDPGLGLLLFDAFGQYIQTISLPGKTLVQTLGDQLVLRDATSLLLINGAGRQTVVALPSYLPPDAPVRITRHHLLYLDRHRLHIRRRRF